MGFYLYLSLILSFFLVPGLISESYAQTQSQWLQQNRGKISELENQLTFPQAINITVRQGQVVSVTGGARRFVKPSENIDQILVTKYQGNFECLDKVGTNRPGNYVDTHELKWFWFRNNNNLNSAKGYRGYAAIAGAKDDTDRVLFETQDVLDTCDQLTFPQGAISTLPITQIVELGATCVGEKKGSIWADFDYVIYDVVNNDTFVVNLTCDKRLAKATVQSRRTSNGRFIQRCPVGMHINGTHQDTAWTRTNKPKYCRETERAQKFKREYDEPGALDVYEAYCPDGFYMKNSDLSYYMSTKRYPQGEFLCFPYKYTWTQKKG